MQKKLQETKEHKNILVSHIIILIRATPSSNDSSISRILISVALVVIADGFRHKVAAPNASAEVKFVLHFDDGYVVVHPS